MSALLPPHEMEKIRKLCKEIKENEVWKEVLRKGNIHLWWEYWWIKDEVNLTFLPFYLHHYYFYMEFKITMAM